MLIELQTILNEIKINISELKKGIFKNLKLKDFINKYETRKRLINKYFDISDNQKITALIGEEYFDNIKNTKNELETSFIAIDNGLNDLLKKVEEVDNFNDFSIAELEDKLDSIYNKQFSIPLLSPIDKKEHNIDISKINPNSNVLSNPAIIKDGDKLICNYNKIIAFKGPICSELYSKPITLNIMSLTDETIRAEIVEIEDNNNYGKDVGVGIEQKEEEEEKEKIELELKEKEKAENEGEKIRNAGVEENDIKNIEEIERKDIGNNKYMRLEKSEIKSKNDIQINITIPENINKGKKEIQKIRRKLKLTSTSSNSQGEVEIEMQILTVPIEILLSCENYELEYVNGVYYLKTYQLFSKEKIIFKIQNYIKGENNMIKSRFEYLEGNTSEMIDLTVEEDKLIVTLPDISNEPKRCNYRIECYILEKAIISQ